MTALTADEVTLRQKSARDAAAMIMSHQVRVANAANNARRAARRRRRILALRTGATVATLVTLAAVLFIR
ncbi:MAG: hypothetical protein J0J04_08300 [Microbacterium sp.]|uniref:hypothetical protein n=1 Tax=Microbacterium sp. TaxID=51671 RepID=UPI001ACD8226|nr:hypothetical protein [Microbacterium sp.]MBN9214802.1 hypothetical protein [Microbacterium sp.]